MSFQGQRAAAKIGEVTGHRDDQNELHPLRGLELDMADPDPALGAKHFDSKQLDCNQGDQEDAVGPRNEVDQLVIVDSGENKHADKPARDPEHLLGVKPRVYFVWGVAE